MKQTMCLIVLHPLLCNIIFMQFVDLVILRHGLKIWCQGDGSKCNFVPLELPNDFLSHCKHFQFLTLTGTLTMTFQGHMVIYQWSRPNKILNRLSMHNNAYKNYFSHFNALNKVKVTTQNAFFDLYKPLYDCWQQAVNVKLKCKYVICTI